MVNPMLRQGLDGDPSLLRTIDLFAGAGGWDVAGVELGLDPLGIEIDEHACATRRAAGFRTLQADIAKLDPHDFPCDVLIASPPCTAFSMAGKGKGRAALGAYAQAIAHSLLGFGIDREWLDTQCDDPTAHLVVEPLRWALALEPTLIACEQVPPVLPLWELMADVLRTRGYSTWTGVLEAERYGVPQTRKRAILMASKTGAVRPPQPTHQRFVSGEPAQHEHTLDGEILPWVSMAEALGWGMTERPCLTVAAGSGRQGGPDPLDGGSGSRAVIEREREREQLGYRLARGAGMLERHGERRSVPDSEPAPVITSKARTATWETLR